MTPLSLLLPTGSSAAGCLQHSLFQYPWQTSALETIARSFISSNCPGNGVHQRGGSFLSRLFQALAPSEGESDLVGQDPFAQRLRNQERGLFQRIERVFRRDPALGRVLDYLQSEAPRLLTSERILKLLRQSRYSEEILRGIRILHDAGISNEEHLSRLIEDGERASELAKAIRALHNSKILADHSSLLFRHPRTLGRGITLLEESGLFGSYYRTLFENPEYALDFARAVRALHERPLLPDSVSLLLEHPRTLGRGVRMLEEAGLLTLHLLTLTQNPEKADLLADALCELHRSGLPNTLLARLVASLQTLYRNQERESGSPRLHEQLSSFPPHASILAEAIRLLDRFDLEIDEHLHFLTLSPQHALHVANGMIVLKQCRLFYPNLLRLLPGSFEYATHLAKGLVILNKCLPLSIDPIDIQILSSSSPREPTAEISYASSGDTRDQFLQFLIQNPAHAESLALGLCRLYEANVLDGRSIEALLEHPEEAAPLARTIVSLTGPNQIDSFLELLQERPENAIALTRAFQYFAEIDRPPSQNLIDDLFQSPAYAESLAIGYYTLVNEGITLPAAYDALFEFPEQALELAEASALFHKHYPLMQQPFAFLLQFKFHAKSVAEGMVILRDSEVLELYDQFFHKFPEHARSFAGGIATLVRGRILTNQFVDALVEHPQYAVSLAEGFVTLNRRGLTSQENLEALRVNPQYAGHIALAIREADWTNSSLQDLLSHSEHAISLALLSRLRLEPPLSRDLRDALIQNPSYGPLDSAIGALNTCQILCAETLSFLIHGAERDVDRRKSLILCLHNMGRLNKENLHRLRMRETHTAELLIGFENYHSLGTLIHRNSRNSPIDDLSFNLLLDHPEFAGDLSWGVSYLRLHDFVDLASSNQITLGHGAHVRALRKYNENSEFEIDRERFDSIMTGVWGGARLAATLLPHWRPIPHPITYPFYLPTDVILQIASFLMPRYEDPNAPYNRAQAALRTEESRNPDLKGRRFKAFSKRAN